ncbi:MAG TPA: TlpA disulfide reductase family protein [Sphingomicrobium sp.]|jgi:thiol-disulfide isomerase/thioredoxin|nr:TlpA disulfide reductase family protein [Sphingomicrobium sp.]
MIRPLLIGVCVLALCACQKPSQPTSNQASAAASGEQVKGVDRSHKGAEVPAANFNDPDGKPASLKTFAGKPTLVNLWASWCAPCVKELPTLDQLARSENGKLNVVAISQDMDVPHASVVAFLKTHSIASLKSYQDPKMALSGALGAEVLPTSILYDAKGREIWRYVGDQDWTSAAAAKLVAESGVQKGS